MLRRLTWFAAWFAVAARGKAMEWFLAKQEMAGESVRSATYLSEAFALLPGEFVYTDEDETPMEFPRAEGPYAITGFVGDIVYAATNESVPLSEVYDHHWVITHTGFANALCRDGPTYTFGIGAESRDTPVAFPEGYGYHVPHPRIYWGANIHCLRTEYLAGDDKYEAVKECNECYYAPGKGCSPRQNGTFTCCGDRSDTDDDDDETVYRCPVAADAPAEPVSYRLRYTLNYTTTDAVASARIGVLTTPDCDTYYNVLRDDDSPEHLSSTTFTVPVDLEILLAIGHQHVGALNISLFVNDRFVCASFPTYGASPGVPGDEQGYLVKMSDCFRKASPDASPLVLRQGDTVRLDSWYWVGSDDPRIAPLPGGTHLNVMGYMYTVFAAAAANETTAQATPPWRVLATSTGAGAVM